MFDKICRRFKVFLILAHRSIYPFLVVVIIFQFLASSFHTNELLLFFKFLSFRIVSRNGHRIVPLLTLPDFARFNRRQMNVGDSGRFWVVKLWNCSSLLVLLVFSLLMILLNELRLVNHVWDVVLGPLESASARPQHQNATSIFAILFLFSSLRVKILAKRLRSFDVGPLIWFLFLFVLRFCDSHSTLNFTSLDANKGVRLDFLVYTGEVWSHRSLIIAFRFFKLRTNEAEIWRWVNFNLKLGKLSRIDRLWTCRWITSTLLVIFCWLIWILGIKRLRFSFVTIIWIIGNSDWHVSWVDCIGHYLIS